MRKQGIDGTGVLNLYDRVTGIFNEIFDSRLLTASLFALIGYCTLFTQRKFPMRWMIFVLFGMILLAFVTLTARSDVKARVQFHKGMAVLWFALHGMMVISGLFYQDWLPESVPLLLCYPVIYSVFASRDDEKTFRSILRGAVFAVMPFLIWSYLTVPVTIGYPGYMGVFYDANCLSMCCIVMTTAAALLAYASFTQRHMKSMIAYALCAAVGAVTLLLTLSRSGLLAFAGVMAILAIAIIAGTAKRPGRLLAILAVVLVLVGAAGVKITADKVYEAAVEDYELAVYNHEPPHHTPAPPRTPRTAPARCAPSAPSSSRTAPDASPATPPAQPHTAAPAAETDPAPAAETATPPRPTHTASLSPDDAPTTPAPDTCLSRSSLVCSHNPVRTAPSGTALRSDA